MKTSNCIYAVIGLALVGLMLTAGASGAEKKAAVVKAVESPGRAVGLRAIPVIVETEVPIAGVQIVLGYDPAALTVGKPWLNDRASGMTLASNERGGEVIILVYSPEGNIIAAGSGPILTVQFTAKSPELRAKSALRFEEVILAASCTEAIPVRIEPIVLKTVPVPTEFALAQNYPNPFNPTTQISFQLPVVSGQSPVHTILRIYNILGQEVRTLVDEVKEPGYYTVTWDGKDSDGRQAASGVYFYRLTAGEFTATKRMVLMK